MSTQTRSVVTDDDGNQRYVSPPTLAPTSTTPPEPEPRLEPGRSYSQADLFLIMAGREPATDDSVDAEQQRQRDSSGRYRRDALRAPANGDRVDGFSNARLLRIMTGKE